MNEDKIIQALTAYQGTEESLNETVGVLSEELGSNWTETVFEQLGGLSVELKDKLNHVFNYYAALMAWQETSGYLEQKQPFDEKIQERLPVLKHWLDFFGDPGKELYNQLEQKLSTSSQEEAAPALGAQENVQEKVSQEEIPSSKEELKEEETPENQGAQEEIPSQKEELKEEKAPGNQGAKEEKQEVETKQENSDSLIPKEEAEPKEKADEIKADMQSPEAFTIQKAKKEIALLDSLQAWLSARCLQLNNMEVFAYPYYGLVVDLMRQVVKDIQLVLDLKDKKILPDLYEGGEEAIVRKKQAIESDIETAVQNCESATTALIDEGVNMDDVRKTLGNLDESTEPEYLGPAPDGFELIQDSDEPLDENKVKEQYQRLEKEVLAETEDQSEKNTSQNVKNSVQKKLSFSLKPKK